MLGKEGETLWLYANGLDDTPVRHIGQRDPPKSISNGSTFRRDLVGWDQLHAGLTLLADEVAARLRAEGAKCRVVQVTIKDPLFHSICRQKQLDRPTYLQKELVDAAMALLRANWQPNAPVRSLTIAAQQLTPKDAAQEQLCFWNLDDSLDDRYDRLENTIDQIRLRFGRGCIRRGCAPLEVSPNPIPQPHP